MTATTTWRKLSPNPSSSTSLGMAPTGRRGHSVVLYGDAMHVYGGYQDLRGSSSELWTFDFSEFYCIEEWIIVSSVVNDIDNPLFTSYDSWVEGCAYPYPYPYANAWAMTELCLSPLPVVLSIKSIASTLYTELCSMFNVLTISGLFLL